MAIKSEVNQNESIDTEIETLTTNKIIGSLVIYPDKSKSYRLQEGEHEGSGVFFNPEGAHTRYGLVGGKKGSLYVANTPRTSMKEVFQNIPAIKSEDLDEYYMATLVTEKKLNVVDLTLLAPKMHVTAHQLTGGDYKTTQKLAEKLSQHADGLMYVSNVTLEPCIVLWHDDPSGKGLIRTEEFTTLSKFEFEGKIAEDILVEDLDIPVI